MKIQFVVLTHFCCHIFFPKTLFNFIILFIFQEQASRKNVPEKDVFGEAKGTSKNKQQPQKPFGSIPSISVPDFSQISESLNFERDHAETMDLIDRYLSDSGSGKLVKKPVNTPVLPVYPPRSQHEPVATIEIDSDEEFLGEFSSKPTQNEPNFDRFDQGNCLKSLVSGRTCQYSIKSSSRPRRLIKTGFYAIIPFLKISFKPPNF